MVRGNFCSDKNAVGPQQVRAAIGSAIDGTIKSGV